MKLWSPKEVSPKLPNRTPSYRKVRVSKSQKLDKNKKTNKNKNKNLEKFKIVQNMNHTNSQFVNLSSILVTY